MDTGALAPPVILQRDLIAQLRRIAAGGQPLIGDIDALAALALTLFTLLSKVKIDAGDLRTIIAFEGTLSETNYFIVVLLFDV